MIVRFKPESDCDGLRPELITAIARETPNVGLSPELRMHLTRCVECRETLMQSRDIVAELRALCQPVSLSDELISRIEQRVHRSAETGVRRLWRRTRPVLAAAAALLLAALYLPVERSAPASQPDLALSSSDLAELIATIGLVEWEGTVEWWINRAAAELEETSQLVDRSDATARVLPWSAEDDWDTPAAVRGGMVSPARAPSDT
jgi:hypothetical protein